MPTLFTDRRNGASLAPYQSLNLALHVGDAPTDVAHNRETLSALTGPIQFMNQVHSDGVVQIHKHSEIEPTCDALITTQKGIALAVLVADCIPLLLLSDHVVGAVHVGRRGLVNSIAIKTVHAMRELGALSIHAMLGPSICGQCYEVPAELAKEVVQLHPQAASTTKSATPALDLAKALIADLAAIDVSAVSDGICTLENENYYSYRRNKVTGRSAGVVWL